MNRTIEMLHRVFAVGVAVATAAAVLHVFTRPEASLGEDLDEIFGLLALGALLEMMGLVLLEGYRALRGRS